MFLAVTHQAERDAWAVGYIYQGVEGWIAPLPSAASVPLKLYWHSGRGDNFLTATQQGEADAQAAGYSYVRNEGYVFPSQVAGSVPLQQYWHAGRGDNFLLTTQYARNQASVAGYQFVRNEAWVTPPDHHGPPPKPLKLYWHSGRGDNFSTPSFGPGEADAISAGYRFVRDEGWVFQSSNSEPGLVPLKLYWHPGRGDNFSTATQQGEQDAQDAGYSFIRNEGYIHPSRGNWETGTRDTLELYWSDARQDNFSFVTAQAKIDADNAGYGKVRDEGYVLITP